MKEYRINQDNPSECELAKILTNNGLIEFTDANKYSKGKRYFSKTVNDKYAIIFDYINIRIVNGAWVRCNQITISEEEIRCILTFMNLEKKYQEYLFDINPMPLVVRIEKISSLDKKGYPLSKISERKKMIPIMDTYNSIKI